MMPGLAIAAITIYLAATAAQIVALRRAWPDMARIACRLGLVACMLHAAALAASWHGIGGMDMHFFAALSTVMLGTTALTALLGLRRSTGALGLVLYPIAAMVVLLYPLLTPATPTPAVMTWPIQLHAALSLLAYAALSLATLLAVMLWLQERALRQRQVGGWLRAFPPLTLLESLMFRLILAGFCLLSLALLTGAVFMEDLFAQHLAHKTVLSLLAWTVLGILLYGRRRHGWRGRRAVHWTLVAMALLALAFFGSKFVLELVLTRST